jgi:hypothetical protein
MTERPCATRCDLCGSGYRVSCLPPEGAEHGHICAGRLWIETMMARLSGRLDQTYQPYWSLSPVDAMRMLVGLAEVAARTAMPRLSAYLRNLDRRTQTLEPILQRGRDMMERKQATTWDEVFAQWHGGTITPCRGLCEYLEYVLAVWGALGRPSLQVRGAIITDLESWLQEPRLLSELAEADQSLWALDAGEVLREPHTGLGIVFPDERGEGWHVAFWRGPSWKGEGVSRRKGGNR